MGQTRPNPLSGTPAVVLFTTACRCVACLAATLSLGCSFLLSTRPNTYESRGLDKPVCEVNYRPPIVDTAMAIGGAALLAVFVSTNPKNHWPDKAPNTSGPLALGTVGVLAWTGSAIYGYNSAAECRAAHERWKSRNR